MARVLMASVPAYGLTNPSLPLAAALVAGGHGVDYLTGDSFRRPVERCGATLLPFADYLGGPLVHPRQLAQHARRLFSDLTAGMVRLAPRYDVVIGAGLQPGLSTVERSVSCPVVQVSPVFLQNDRTIRHFADLCTGLPAPVRRVMATPPLRRRFLGALGRLAFGERLDDISDVLGPQSSRLTIVTTSRLHQPFDADFDERCVYIGPTPTLPAADDAFPIERLREHHGPVVYATLGTVFNRWTPFFRTIIDAFAGSEVLVVVTTGGAAGLARLGEVPDNVMARSFVPQRAVLERADACFTHGGFGSATDCIALGVPPVLTPMGADQFFNAYRLQELGAGRVLTRPELTVGSVRRAMDWALTDTSVHDSISRLRRSFAEAGGPPRGVAAIEALLA